MYETIVYPANFEIPSYSYYYPRVSKPEPSMTELDDLSPLKYVTTHANLMENPAKIKREDAAPAKLKKEPEIHEDSYEHKKAENKKDNEETYHKHEEKSYEKEFHKTSGDKKDKKYEKEKKYSDGKYDGEYKSKNKNKKGKKKSGYHNLFVKDESKMKHKFYDSSHEQGQHSHSKNSKASKAKKEMEAEEKKYGKKYSKEY